jgi:hypothetical protein
MRKECDKRDEQLTACIQTDWVGCPFLESFGTIIESLDELEHRPSFKVMNEDSTHYLGFTGLTIRILD